MTELLDVKPDHKVLEVGTGSGYQAAILAELADEVYTLERFPDLAEAAQGILNDLGYQNIHVLVGDGTLGYAPAVPFDRVIVTAAAPKVPDPLLEQLGHKGRLVIPVGSRHMQYLEVWDRDHDKFHKSVNVPVVFVPLVGEEGWKE
jgi:protein-L-isoaspartate(D-aspartate) O-methyltransferase